MKPKFKSANIYNDFHFLATRFQKENHDQTFVLLELWKFNSFEQSS